MIALFVFALLSQPALARMGDGELGPQRPVCDLNQVNSCSESERVAGLNARAAGEALDPQISALSPVVARLASDRDQAQTRLDGMAATELLLKDEIAFLAKGEEPTAKEILPGFASLEDFFGLTAPERTWQERYPTEREQLLNAQLGEMAGQELESKNRLQEISSKFGSLNGQYQSLLSQKANLFADASAHASMSDTGCYQRMCPR